MSSTSIATESNLSLKACYRLPKVELHAHFFGSIKPSTIRRIAASKKHNVDNGTSSERALKEGSSADSSLPQQKKPDLDAAFNYFSWIYSVVKAASDMQHALMEVIEDFHRDNVVYLELRSSLKNIPEEGVDPQSYVDMLVEGCKEAEKKWGMTVGFDIAGHPEAGDITYTLHRLKQEVLRNDGKFFGTKKLTVHTAEVTEEQQAFVAKQGICVEVCPTSNMCTLKLKYASHQEARIFRMLY
ncbi:hypothetical protein ACSSS7_002624 [Eimeria intestinalis]